MCYTYQESNVMWRYHALQGFIHGIAVPRHMSHQSTVIIELASRVSDSNCSANTLVKERHVLEINGNGVQRDLDKRSELKASTDAYLGHLVRSVL